MGVKQIKITAEMIAAGTVVYEKWIESEEWDYRKFIARIYRAMHAARPKDKSKAKSRQRLGR